MICIWNNCIQKINIETGYGVSRLFNDRIITQIIYISDTIFNIIYSKNNNKYMEGYNVEDLFLEILQKNVFGDNIQFSKDHTIMSCYIDTGQWDQCYHILINDVKDIILPINFIISYIRIHPKNYIIIGKLKEFIKVYTQDLKEIQHINININHTTFNLSFSGKYIYTDNERFEIIDIDELFGDIKSAS